MSSWADKIRGGAAPVNPHLPSLGGSSPSSPAVPSTVNAVATPALGNNSSSSSQSTSTTATTTWGSSAAAGAAAAKPAQSSKAWGANNKLLLQQDSSSSSSSPALPVPAVKKILDDNNNNNNNAVGAKSSVAIATPAANNTSGGTDAAAAAAAAGGGSKAPVFDYYVVIDFEATCENNARLKYQEIIEFPSVLVDANRCVVVSEFQRYVRPVHNPTLTQFCKNLTGIPQIAVDEAPCLPQVWSDYMAWLASSCGFDPSTNSHRFAWVSCGDWDLKTMLPAALSNPRGVASPGNNNSNNSKINWSVLPAGAPDFLKRWVNLKTVYQRITNRRIGSMHDMGSAFGTAMAGHHHSGIWDSRNIAKCLIALLRKGIPVDLTWGQLSPQELQLRQRGASNNTTNNNNTSNIIKASFASSLAILSAEAQAALEAQEKLSLQWQETDQQQQRLTSAPNGAAANNIVAAPASTGNNNNNNNNDNNNVNRRQQKAQDVGPTPPNTAATAAAGGQNSKAMANNNNRNNNNNNNNNNTGAAGAAAAAKPQLLVGPFVEVQGTTVDAVRAMLAAANAAAPAALDPGAVTAISKRMSNALRHNALQWNIPMSLNGWVKVKDLLRNNRFNTATTQQLAAVVSSNDKQRFQMGVCPADREIYIRACQGHSIEDLIVDMEVIRDAPVAVHGTNLQAWEKIRTQGLSRMSRHHVHFASGLPGDDGVVSGMRARSQVLVYFDVKKATLAGMKVFKSANGVILTAGFDGLVPPAFFAKVVDASSGRNLQF